MINIFHQHNIIGRTSKPLASTITCSGSGSRSSIVLMTTLKPVVLLQQDDYTEVHDSQWRIIKQLKMEQFIN